MAPPHRPATLVVVAGTGTDIGKTWVGSQLAGELRRRGLTVAARKPAQSFDPAVDQPLDADLLAAATGESVADVCPPARWYTKPMAPPMAAESMGLAPFTLRDIRDELRWPPATDVGIVEQAGGIGAPQASDGDGVDMVELLDPDLVVLVALPGLGTLSNISLAVRALGSRRLVVYMNYFDPTEELHAANLSWLRQRAGLAVEVSVSSLAGDVAGLRGP